MRFRTLPVCLTYLPVLRAAVCLFASWSWFFSTAVQAEPIRYEKHVVPILKAHCYRCHGSKTQKGELNLETVAGILQGSESGPILNRENAEESRLLEVVAHAEMPPEDADDPLSKDEIETLQTWIQGGAPMESAVSFTAMNQHDVLPILLRRCATCHGRQVQEGGLDIRSLDALLKGGKSGPAVVAGDPAKSLLLNRIRQGEMPPREKLAKYSVKPVEPSELAKLEKWIAAGAPWSPIQSDMATDAGDRLVSDEDRSFWAFQPPKKIHVPRFSAADAWSTNPIDRFILKKLNAKNLKPSPPASRTVLIRRITYDLLGLPPNVEELDAFVSDHEPAAYQTLVDRLLASPAYGERWGQYWLDLSGYCDSEGIQHADPVRPHSYRYRDYVIRAFNSDKPYDRFLLEQIAGDELADYENAATITDEIYDNLVATGFLRQISDGTFAGITGFLPNRLDVIDAQIHVLSSSIMGLSVRCARCHSHKFDPIPQRDYYRLVAVFKGAMDEFDWLSPIQSGVRKPRYLPHVTTQERKNWDQTNGEINERKKLKDLAQDESRKKQLDEQIKNLERARGPEPMIRALWDRGQPSPTYLLRRGDYRQPARLIGPGPLAVLTADPAAYAPQPPWPHSNKTGNRLAFANWLTRPDHPLTARVIVNRIWKHHFGRGIVEPLDDFGRAGGKPTHPGLLDWLSNQLVQNNWSVKWLHRLILTSSTYRQSSTVNGTHRKLDPENHLLTRMPMRRMEAEVLRDSLLALADRLNRSQFGPADPVKTRTDGLVTSVSDSGAWRRSIYVMKRRTERLTILDSYDRPRMSPNCVNRPVSTVATQALHLMNNRMIHDLADSLAGSIMETSAPTLESRIHRLFNVVVNRTPSDEEMRICSDTFHTFRQKWSEQNSSQHPLAEKDVTQRALGNLCHAMMNSASFLYID